MPPHLSFASCLATVRRLALISAVSVALRAAPETIAYHGWNGALRLRNAQVETIVVPAIGRVMSFRFRGGENVFWDDRSLDGRQGDATMGEWVNFGGDKTWPAPNDGWQTFTHHKTWMPPPAFDSLPATARLDGDTVVLTSALDPFYGIRTTRRIALRGETSTMTIETTYERVSGAPAKISIWVITQFRHPLALYLPIPSRSIFPGSYVNQIAGPWPQISAGNGLVRLTRDGGAPHKLGSDADRMLWVGEKDLCLVSAPRLGAEQPDAGASVEVYTNPDPKAYIELETLAPLVLLRPGDRTTQTNTYTLFHRTGADPETEARRAFAALGAAQ